MGQLICAYSSDARPLYKADIYKVLSMPKGFIVHFRYKLKYVDDEILNNLKKHIGKEVVIFYTITKYQNENNINIPIRKANLINAEIIKETSLFHAYLELEDFVNAEILENINKQKFFTLSKLEFKNENKEWINKIEKVKESFSGVLFYYIKSIKTYNGKEIKIQRRQDRKSSFYILRQGKKYIIELSIGNPSETDCKLKFTSSSNDITANIPNPMEISAQYDDIYVPIYIKSLNVSNDLSFISFFPQDGIDEINTEYNLNIEIEKKYRIY